ncbi:MAG: copper amine oxidase N-terminal domain-containing protein [Nitrososphaeria archaeon]
MRKKFLLDLINVFIILIIMFVVVPSNRELLAAEYSPLFQVEVSPNNAGSVGSYRIFGSYSTVNGISILKVIFPPDTSLKSNNIPINSVLVNGNFVSRIESETILSDGSLAIYLYLKDSVNSGDNLEINFNKDAGIVNPTVPAGCYRIYVRLLNSQKVEISSIISIKYTIERSAIKEVNVKPEIPVTGVKSKYLITFLTGIRGNLKANSDAIKIKFPQSFLIPSIPSRDYVFVNGNIPSGVYRDGNEPNTIKIFTPIDIPSNSLVEVILDYNFGLVNTSLAGDYSLYVSTSSEPTWVSSNFSIIDPEISNLVIDLDPDVVSLNPYFKVSFITSPYKTLVNGDHIYIGFPHDFNLNNVNFSSFVLVNGVKLSYSVEDYVLKVTLQQVLPPLSSIVIEIPKDVNIISPTKDGDYFIAVWDDKDTRKVYYKINIKETQITNLHIEPSTTLKGSRTALKVSFNTGQFYGLAKNLDSVIIDFRGSFTLDNSVSIKSGGVLLNGIPVEVLSFDDSLLNIVLPTNIEGGMEIVIEFSEDFGLRIPEQPGKYSIFVSTSKEKKFVESNYFEVTELPTVEFKTEPVVLEGEAYKTEPIVMLTSPNGIKIYYKLDEGDFIEYTSPFKINEGSHKVYAYAVDKDGNKGQIFTKDFIVDLTPPKISIKNSFNGKLFFNSSEGIISGEVNEPCKVAINSVPIELSANLTFEYKVVNIVDNMPIVVVAVDSAGNVSSTLLQAKLDFASPIIAVTNLNGLDTDEINIETTSKNYLLKLSINEPSYVFLNGKLVNSYPDNNFEIDLSLSDGLNEFKIEAIDLAQNKSQKIIKINKRNERIIEIKVGEKTAKIDGNLVYLETPAFIENGYTYVPIRFIGECFGANVSFKPELRAVIITYGSHQITLIVGSINAILDEKTYKLQAPPKIVEGRTFVPIRFISEAFGAKVEWEEKTKTITITYKP